MVRRDAAAEKTFKTPGATEYTPADVSLHNTEKDCWVIVSGKAYDVTTFVKEHPGGQRTLLSQAGLDATDVFATFHPVEVEDLLGNYYVGDVVGEAKVTKVVQDFRNLRKEMMEQGLFDSSKLYYAFKSVQFLAIAGVAIWMIAAFPHVGIARLASAVLMGLFFQQAGWLGHDYSHHQAFKNHTINNYCALFVANFCQGFSVSWWKNKHNTHHAACNVAGHDTDIDTVPLLAWSEKMLPSRIHETFARFTLSYQAFTFIPLLFFARISWAMQSLEYALKAEWCPRRAWEVSLIIGHWVSIFGITFALLPIRHAIVYILIANMTCGLFLGSVFVISHNGMEVLDKMQHLKCDFFSLQARTTRNITTSLFWDFFTGGLNYQLEHHLFPTMPRHNFSKAAPMVKKVCLANNLPYETCGFFSGTGDLITHLSDVADEAKKRM